MKISTKNVYIYFNNPNNDWRIDVKVQKEERIMQDQSLMDVSLPLECQIRSAIARKFGIGMVDVRTDVGEKSFEEIFIVFVNIRQRIPNLTVYVNIASGGNDSYVLCTDDTIEDFLFLISDRKGITVNIMILCKEKKSWRIGSCYNTVEKENFQNGDVFEVLLTLRGD